VPDILCYFLYFRTVKLLRIILLPFSILYGCILFVRNKLYDWRVLPSTQFNIPIISVGNLSVGGTGKTPHVEYLIRLLKAQFYIATLSRGYGRKTKGFILSDTQSTAQDIGDESLQFKKKFSGLRVAVDENRVRGVKKMLHEFPSLQVVLLDDAFQHRAIKPGVSIVLTEFHKLYFNDYVVPSGKLREFRSGIQRADIIIVTKCPFVLLPIERKRLINEIKPLPHQRVYFSYIKYGDFLPLNSNDSNLLAKEYYFERNFQVVLLTGIANTKSLDYYLKDKIKHITPVKFPDHHQYTREDINKVKKIFDEIPSANKIILTTEKDAMRLMDPQFAEIVKRLPIFYMPIEIEFHHKDKNDFDEQISHYVHANQKHNK
jgi:tetraacyldisaccharide 4'-kinase